MEFNDIKTYLDLYETSIKLNLGYAFSYRQFVSLLPKNPFIYDAIRDNNPEEDFPIPWYELFLRAVQKINQIIDKPQRQLKYESAVKLTGMANKVTNQNLLDTAKVPEFWYTYKGQIVPEKVYTDMGDDTIIIYENRFIVYLIDRMLYFLNKIEREIIEHIKKLSDTYSYDKLRVSDINVYEDIRKFRTFYDIDGFCNLKSSNKDHLLSLEDSPYIKILDKISKLERDITRFKNSDFYKTIKHDRPLSSEQVHATNILNDDRNYAPCYEFYEKVLKPLLNELETKESKIKSPVFDPIKYHNFVVLNLIATLYKRNFTNTWPHKDLNIFFNRKNLIQLVNFGLSKNNVKITLNTCKFDEIKITITVNKIKAKLNHEKETVDRTNVSCIMLKVIPNFDDQINNKEKVKEDVIKITEKYLYSGYDNCFILTNNNFFDIPNLTLVSPFAFKNHSNLETLLESCLLFIRADNTVYKKICPVCGSYVLDGSDVDGNVYCANCGSSYAIINEDEDGTKKNTIWIKKYKETL